MGSDDNPTRRIGPAGREPHRRQGEQTLEDRLRNLGFGEGALPRGPGIEIELHARVPGDHRGDAGTSTPHVHRMTQGGHAIALQEHGGVGVLPHDRHPVIRNDKEGGQLPSPFPDASDEGTDGAVHEPVALEHGGVQRILEMRDAIDAWKHDKEETPRLVRGVEPGLRDRAIERRVRSGVMGNRSQHDTAQSTPVAAGLQPARQRCADRDTLGDEIENRGSGDDVGVQPATLHPTIAPRGAPLFAPPAPGPAAIEPTNSGNVDTSGIATEQEWDVSDAGRGRKDRRPRPQSARLDHPAREIRQVATSEQIPQHIDACAVDQHDDRAIRGRRRGHLSRPSRSGCCRPLPAKAERLAQGHGRNYPSRKQDHGHGRPNRIVRSRHPQRPLERRGIAPTPLRHGTQRAQ